MTQPPYGGGYPAPYPPQGYPPQQVYPQQQPYQSAPGQPPQPQGHQMPPQPQVQLGSPEDFFSGGGSGAPSFDFKGINHGLIGTITHQQIRQRTEMGDASKKKWNNDGSPQVQLEVTLQTDLRNWQDVKNIPTGEDGVTPLPPQSDTGLRRVYVWYKMRDAVQLAVGKAGAKSTEIGGRLGVKQSGTEINTKGVQPIRTYEAVYYPPAPSSAAVSGFLAPPPQPQYAPQPGPSQQLQQAIAQPQQQYTPPPQQQFAPIPPQRQAAEPPF